MMPTLCDTWWFPFFAFLGMSGTLLGLAGCVLLLWAIVTEERGRNGSNADRDR